MTLKVGDTAPEFTLLSDQWKTVKLSDYRGKKNVFLAVYVLAFTGGERSNFRRSRLESPPKRLIPRIRKFSELVWIVPLPTPRSPSRLALTFPLPVT